MSAATPFVAMKGVTKKFGNTIALSGVDFETSRGEVHALLGENGAGKTTLMNVLFGLYKADEGEIFVEGKSLKVDGPRDAIAAGIFMVHQHFRLINNFTSLENVMLGSTHGFLTHYESARQLVEQTCETYGLHVDLDSKVKNLPVGMQQRVELLKALSTKPKLLILDEPTSSLTPQEADSVLKSISEFAKRGLAVVLITHKVREVLAVSQRITVLKAGQLVKTISGNDIDEKRLVEMMMGSDRIADRLLHVTQVGGTARTPLEEILLIQDLKVLGSRKEIAVNGATLSIRKGEILGLAGVSGNGQRELAEAVVGVRKIAQGQLIFAGKKLERANPRDLIELGVGYIPEDRMGSGLLPSMNVVENLILGHHRDPPYSRRSLVNYREAVADAGKSIAEYAIKAEGPETTAGKLSGGNIQKLMVARALLNPQRLIVAHNPTRGLDISATDFVLKSLLKQKENGSAVLLISEDLDELMLVSDRICAMYKGEIMGCLTSDQFDRYEIGNMMAGNRMKNVGASGCQ